MEPVELHDWRYMVEMGCGVDAWKLNGRAYGHPNVPQGGNIYTSTPVSFDEVNMLVTTASGRLYKLYNCAGNLEEQKANIREDISKGGTQLL